MWSSTATSGSPATVALAATFTLEPLEPALQFWAKSLRWPATIEFAPYNQIFQELLNPASLFGTNASGVNLLLVRWEDWWNELAPGSSADEAASRNLTELLEALQGAASRSATPHVLAICPPSAAAASDPVQAALIARLSAQLAARAADVPNLVLVTDSDWALYPVASPLDEIGDRLGHVPYTAEWFAAAATVLARKVQLVKSAPAKVIVLDCDNTLWKGVVGEDGVAGVELTPGYLALQAFMVEQTKAGMILCLCSKNTEADALEVFEKRPDMVLKKDLLVSWRINWNPKSANLRELAAELNVGLDSFIFLDDNPVECAEVRAACPEVLTLQLPLVEDPLPFLRHVWSFDHLKVTAEDQKRTDLYKQNAERNKYQKESGSLTGFLAGLNISIQIEPPRAENIPRVSQLTQRTNQFNTTTLRRTEAEVLQLGGEGKDCRMVHVSDRFGDYGLVGVVTFGTAGKDLVADSLMLSCRVLGRGVEHAMVRELGKVASDRGLGSVVFPFVPTKKNQPVLNFLENLPGVEKRPEGEGTAYRLSAAAAAALETVADSDGLALAAADAAKGAKSSVPAEALQDRSELFQSVAQELSSPAEVLARSEQAGRRRRTLAAPAVPPTSATEHRLVQHWRQVLGVDEVGIRDSFFDLGGTSLLTVGVFAWIEREFGRKLPLTTILGAPTIAQLAAVINRSDGGEAGAVVPLSEGTGRPLFLIHDGDGEVLLYRNLARRLGSSIPVYGVQPVPSAHLPLGQSRIEQMAAGYVAQIRGVQPTGPYRLGGMCAGGVLAFETARQLQAAGQEVDLVAMMDSANVQSPRKTGVEAEARLNRLSGALSSPGSAGPLAKLLRVPAVVWKKGIGFLSYQISSRWKKMKTTSRLKTLRRTLDQGRPLPAWASEVTVRQMYNFAEEEYRPSTAFQGSVVLLRATKDSGQGGDQPFRELYADPLLGWQSRVAGTVEAHDVPGGHSSMLQEPLVEAMAETLRPYLEKEPKTK